MRNPEAHERSTSTLVARAFPGSTHVWKIAFALGVLLSIVLLYQVAFVERDYYTGTPSVGGESPVTQPQQGHRVCQERVQLPRNTGRARFDVRPLAAGGTLEATVASEGRVTRGRSKPVSAIRQYVDVPFKPLHVSGQSAPARICVRPLGPGATFFGVRSELESDAVGPTLDGFPVGHLLAYWFLPRTGAKRTMLEALPDIVHRAALFRPSPFGPWTPIAVLLLLPAVGYLALRTLACAAAQRRSRFPPLAAVMVVAYVSAASWALITPPFDAPDENDHYAYTQYLAETGKAPCQVCRKAPRSSEEAAALDAVSLAAYFRSPQGRPPWLGVDERRWRATDTRERPPGDNGGGVTTAVAHGPAYYLFLVPGYHVADALGGDVFARLTAMRLVSALLAAMMAGFVFLTARELFPRQPLLPVLAGFLVGLQPMVAFIGGAVINDTGINAVVAGIAFLLVRILRRGLTLRRGVVVAGALVLAPLVKTTGYFAYPPALLALAFVALRQRSRRDVVAWAGTALTFIVLTFGWSRLSKIFDRGVYGTPGGVAPTSQPQAAVLTEHPLTYLSYLWQVFLPRLSFMPDLQTQTWPAFAIYIEGGFAAFGWYIILFPPWVYHVIGVVVACVTVLALNAARLNMVALRSRWRELAVLAALTGVVVAGVHASFVSGVAGDWEQGRYAFTTLAALGTFAAGGAYGLGKAWASTIAAVLLVLTLGLFSASELLGLLSFYT